MGYIMDAIYNYSFLLPIFIILELVFYKYYKMKDIKMKKGAIIAYQCLMLLLMAMLTITGAGDLNDLWQNGTKYISEREMNVIPIVKWGISDLYGFLMNIVLFVPLGMMIPLVWKKGTSLIKTTFIGFSFSLLIELSQLFNWRATDIDDLLTNTVGTVIGYILYAVFLKKVIMFQVDNDQPGKLIENSALITILLVFVLYFCVGSQFIKFIWNSIY